MFTTIKKLSPMKKISVAWGLALLIGPLGFLTVQQSVLGDRRAKMRAKRREKIIEANRKV